MRACVCSAWIPSRTSTRAAAAQARSRPRTARSSTGPRMSRASLDNARVRVSAFRAALASLALMSLIAVLPLLPVQSSRARRATPSRTTADGASPSKRVTVRIKRGSTRLQVLACPRGRCITSACASIAFPALEAPSRAALSLPPFHYISTPKVSASPRIHA